MNNRSWYPVSRLAPEQIKVLKHSMDPSMTVLLPGVETATAYGCKLVSYHRGGEDQSRVDLDLPVALTNPGKFQCLKHHVIKHNGPRRAGTARRIGIGAVNEFRWPLAHYDIVIHGPAGRRGFERIDRWVHSVIRCRFAFSGVIRSQFIFSRNPARNPA